MNLKLNISKKGLSTTEEVINKDTTLNFGQIFRGQSAYEQAQDGGYEGTKEQFNGQLAKINEMLTKSDVVNNLNSTYIYRPLSASQGNVLNLQKVGFAEYDSERKDIVFYSDESKRQEIAVIDVTPFIKDGMVHSVSVDPETQIITITFNTDAGKEDIEVDLATVLSGKINVVPGNSNHIPKLEGNGQLSASNYTEDDLREMDNRHRIISYEFAKSEDYTELFSINSDLSGNLQTGDWRMSVPSGNARILLPASVDMEAKDGTIWATFTAQQISDKSTESAKIYLHTIYKVVFKVDTDTNKWVCVTSDKKELYPTIIVPKSINEGDSLMQAYADIVYSSMPVIMQIKYEGKVISAPVNFSTGEESGTQVIKFTGVGHIGNETYTQTITCDENFVVIEVGEVKKFMPATPSGAPEHYTWLKYNGVTYGTFTGADGNTYGQEGKWGVYAERGGLADLSNEDMRIVVAEMQSVSKTPALFATTKGKTNIIVNNNPFVMVYSGEFSQMFRNNTTVKVVNLCVNDKNKKCEPVNLSNSFVSCRSLNTIIGEIGGRYLTNTTSCFAGCTALKEVRISGLKVSISFADSPDLSYESVRYMIAECASNATFTITLHPTVKAKVQTGGEWNIGIEEALSIAREKGTTIDFGE